MKEKLFSGQSADKKIYEYIQEETVDEVVLSYVLPNETPNQWENSLYDYKRDIPNSHGNTTDSSLYECLKDVIAFHNSYGGYIIFGVDHYSQIPIYGCNNVNSSFSLEKFNEKITKYTGKKIICKLNVFSVQNNVVALLLVPKRPENIPPVSFIRGSPAESGKQLFEAGFTPVRMDDSCKRDATSSEDIQFLCSCRDFLSARSKVYIDNNIPFIDKTYTKFFGRASIFYDLWSWFSKRKAGTKLLNAFGGMGKTSLAYEFCEQLLAVGPPSLDKIIWLTAKKQNFDTHSDSFRPLSRTDFSNVNDFLLILASHVGIPDQEAQDIEVVDFLIEAITLSLREFNILVVIDDIDSLEKSEQLELNRIITNIVNISNNNSKALITSRLTLGTAPSQLISLGGLDQKEFKSYAQYLFKESGIEIINIPIKHLHEISGGAPIFISSILRLTRNMSISDAIEAYKGKSGEAVREFAFRREIEALTSIQLKIMFVICYLSSTTQVEIQNILDITYTEFVKDADELSSYSLLVKNGDPASGWNFSAPHQVALMLPVLREKIINPNRIENACVASRRHFKVAPDQVASLLGAITSLWQKNATSEALSIALDAKEAFPKNSDVSFFLGKAYLKITTPDARKAESSFRRASELGGRRADLLENWVRAKSFIKDWPGIIDLRQKFSAPDWKGQTVVSLVIAHKEIATQHAKKESIALVVKYLKDGLEEIKQSFIEKRTMDRIPELRVECREISRAYVQANKILYNDSGNFLEIYESVLFVTTCHITETWIILEGLYAIYKWKESASAKEIKDNKGVIADRLREVFEKISPTFKNRPELMQEMQRCIAQLK